MIAKENRIAIETGDHETYQRIWRKWVRNKKEQKYAQTNSFNIRALRMADNI